MVKGECNYKQLWVNIMVCGPQSCDVAYDSEPHLKLVLLFKLIDLGTSLPSYKVAII